MCERKETAMNTNQEGNSWEEIASRQKATPMDRLDYLVYDPERLACTGEEKDACLETVRKLVRLGYELRREGLLFVLSLAKTEQDPFLRACLLELVFDEGFLELEDEPARLERVFAAYLAAGDYHGGAFLNAVLVTKGLMLLWKNQDVHPAVQANLLSVELRGFFGAVGNNNWQLLCP